MAGRRLRPSQAEIIERFQHVIPDAGRIDEVLGDDPGRSLAEAVGACAGTELIGVSDAFDMAFLRAAKTGEAGEIPPPLPMAPAEAVQERREVYVSGYPASDSRRNDPEEQRRIFANIFDVKRLQPGEISGVEPSASLFLHDCSTLGGNSGSCVVDLETHAIVGLHFSGRFLVANKGIALAHCDDPLIRQVGLEFG